METVFSINGYFNAGGQERLVCEMLKRLDNKVQKGVFEVVVPKGFRNRYRYNNIELVEFGRGGKIIWTQLCFFFYIMKNHRIGINLYNSCPVFRPDIMTIYDMTLENRKEDICRNLHGRLSYLYAKLMRQCAIHGSKLIFTMTNHSKREICRYYHIEGTAIRPFNAGWQHMDEIQRDDSIFEKNPKLKKHEYYLSVSSLAPHKNFQWVINTAKTNKDSIFAIVGSSIGYEIADRGSGNVIFLGRVSDGEMKALMAECKAFIHPAYSEGFGLTPLEALSQGAKIIVSNTSCLPEVYGGTAHYIDPDNADVDLDKLLSEPVERPEIALNKYTWENVAQDFLDNIRGVYPQFVYSCD